MWLPERVRSFLCVCMCVCACASPPPPCTCSESGASADGSHGSINTSNRAVSMGAAGIEGAAASRPGTTYLLDRRAPASKFRR